VRARFLLFLLPVALLVAGCGRGSTAPYTASATAPCLKAKGFTKVTTDPGKVGFIAGFADNGGVFAVAPSSKNTVTIAFAGDASGAKPTEDAFRAHASAFYRKHMSDIMQSKRNAMLVWTTAPTQDQINTAIACLAS
jgi:hypothetical protein